MNAYKADLPQWQHPADYGGFSPDGDYMICGQSRESDALERSNYRTIIAALEAHAATLPEPPEREDIESGGMPWVYDFRAGHWAVGWVDQCLIRQGAPESLLMLAESILAALEDYPVFDEDDWCELEWDDAQDFWASLSVADRIEIIREFGDGVSIFAARRDYMPPDDSGHIYDYIRES